MTSLSLLKTDFVWNTCCVFGVGVFLVCLRGRFHTFPCVVLPSRMVLKIFTFCMDSPCCYLSNKIGFTSIGVSEQKLLTFWSRVFLFLNAGSSGSKTRSSAMQKFRDLF